MSKWNKDKVLIEAQKLIERYGQLPGSRNLRNHGRTDFVMAVRRHYPGNITQLRNDLGLGSKIKPANYWTKQKVIEETKKLIKAEGKMPSQKKMSELGYGTINRKAIKYFGGLIGLAKACGISEDDLSKEFRYWQDFENIKHGISLMTEQLGRFPTTSDFKYLRKVGLLGAIFKYYGGLKNLKKILGIKTKYPVARDGHNCDSYSEIIIDDFLFANKIAHKRDVQLNLGNVKCRPDFILNNGYLIEVLMADYRERGHKGRHKYYIERYLKKKKAYLKNHFKVIEIFPKELVDKTILDKKLIKIAKLANAPSPYRIKDFSYISFFEKKSPGFWRDPENLKKELLPLIKKFGRLPTISELREIGRNDLEGAIINVYGSYWKVAKLIGLKTNEMIKPQKYWQNIENIKLVLLPVIREYGYLPSQAVLMKKGMRNIVAAIEVYHKPFTAFAKLLGTDYKPEKRTNGYWQDPNNIKVELEFIIKKLGHFPTSKDLNQLGFSGLLNGILRKFNSLRNATVQLGLEIPKNKPKGYWKELTNVLHELDVLSKNYKRFPSYSEIEKNNSMLCYAIKNYHGGFVKVKNTYFNDRNDH